MYCERTATHMILFFLDKNRAKGDKMSVMKLIKLLYLSERECIGTYGTTICDDKLFSLPLGPILSHTYDLLAGKTKARQEDWLEWIDSANAFDIKIKDNKTVLRKNLGRLSQLDRDIMQEVWDTFGSMTAGQLSAHTHDPKKIPEWQDPHGSSLPIEYEDVFKAYGCNEMEAKDYSDDIRFQQSFTEKMHQRDSIT